jgi:predicted PurR-regulated permease PerM
VQRDVAGTIQGADVRDFQARPDDRGAPPARLLVHMPVDVRSASLGALVVLASVYTLRWARAVFIPVVLGLMLSYALTPIVNRLKRWHVPRALGAAVLLAGILGGAGFILHALSDDATALVESLPEASQKLRLALRAPGQAPPRTIDNVQKAAAELERAAAEGAVPATPGLPGVTRVEIARPRFNVRDYLWTGTVGLVALAGQIAVVILITYFLLASGDTFRRKMVRLAGPKLSAKRATLDMLNEISAQMQRFLLVQFSTSAIVGLATWLAFAWIGLQHAAVWGVVAGVTNLVPYIGGVLVGAGSALVGFMQFGTLETALLIGGASSVIHAVVGNLVTPWLTSRAGRMSPVTVFVGVLAWGWLWGVWGLLLGVPILTAVKAVCDRVDRLNPVGELLGS